MIRSLAAAEETVPATPRGPLAASARRERAGAGPGGARPAGTRPAGAPLALVPAPQSTAPAADELTSVAIDLARAAVQLAATADALVEAPPERRAALRAALHRWQTLLRLGAQRLTHLASAG